MPEVVLPFVPMFHVLSWGTPFALMMSGRLAPWQVIVRPRRAHGVHLTVYGSGKHGADDLTLESGKLSRVPKDKMPCYEVNLSTGVPTVWQGMRSYIEPLAHISY